MKKTNQTSIKQHFTRAAASKGADTDTESLSMAKDPITMAALDARLVTLTDTLTKTIKDSIRDAILEEFVAKVEECVAPVRCVAENAASKAAALEIRVANNEAKVGENFTIINNTTPKVIKLQGKLEQVEERLEFLEAFSRRSNLRVFGIPEGSETHTGPVAFMSKLLRDLSGTEVFQTEPELERAHRVGHRQEDKGPRAIIMKFLRYQDKTRFEKWAKGKDLQFSGRRVRFVQDLTRSQAMSRAAYKEMKHLLYEKNIKFFHPEPGKLRVIFEEEPHTFNSPSEVKKFLREKAVTSE